MDMERAGSSAVEASYRHLIASTQHHQAQQQHQHQQHYQQQRLRPIAPAPASAPANIAHQQTPVQHRSSSHQQQYHQQGNNRPSNVHPSHHNNISPSLHPQFRAKAVCRLTCKSCLADVCMRGMKAILLADSRVELYSTDRPPKGVQLVYDDYRTRNCKCRIRDVACLGCGNTLGVSCTERFVPKTSSSSPSSPSAASSGSDNGRMSRRLRRDSESSADRVSTAARHVGDAQTPDLILRRRATIHEIGHDSNPRLRHYDDMSHGDSAEEEGEEEEGEIEEDDVDDDSEEESEEEEEEEKPQVMLWAALHAQEERYLQQMQQQQFIIQQQQLQIQQRLLQNQQQQQHDPLGEQNLPLSSAATISPPTVGSRYHSLISTAISNASMMLWDEGRSLNQYEQLCR
ncbi:Protein fam72a [Mortierella sp. GBA43]|nr:Protein fam72a [Mortierella sp. GBA43]